MELITRTLLGSYLQTCTLMGLPMEFKKNTTLNERFEILKDTTPGNTDTPRMRYWAIGNGGHRFTVGADGIHKPEPIQHRATDFAAFKPLPFVLRLPGEDLVAAERQKYALRRSETIDGVQYIAYYLRRMEMTGVVAEMQYITVVDGEQTVTEFVPTAANLYPEPPDLSSTGINVTTGDYVAATAKVALNLNRQDIDELLNVARIKYNDDYAAIISEIQTVSGIDRVINVTIPGSGSFNFNEVIGAQVVSHINTFFPLAFANNGVEVLLDVGATEPLFKLTGSGSRLAPVPFPTA